MSSDKDLIIIKGGNTFQRISRRTFKAMPRRLWREETPKRSASRSKLSVDKKIKKIDKKLRTEQKSLRKRQQQQSVLEVPNPPHNTTQYIISTNTDTLNDQNIYTHTDRFEYDFEHHAMAGSMMDLMRDKFMHMYEQSTTAPSQGAQDSLSEDFVEEKESVVENCPYSEYLKQAESGENLQELVKKLVGVLTEKDQQISFLELNLREQTEILDTEKR